MTSHTHIQKVKMLFLSIRCTDMPTCCTTAKFVHVTTSKGNFRHYEVRIVYTFILVVRDDYCTIVYKMYSVDLKKKEDKNENTKN